MISKERLQELIKQGATIYAVNSYKKDVEEWELNCNLDAVNAGEFMKYDTEQWFYHHYSFDNLFETKEDAEWQLEFGNIQRTETLSLPTWEEFCELDDMFIFYYNEKEYCVGRTNETLESECIGITCHDIDAFGECYSYSIFIEEATKENYIKACRLVKKLFLGEEV